MKKINPLALSVVGGVSIFAATYILFWVLFLCFDSPNAAREAINVLGSYFGGVATLWAAFIAAYLFNDWRISHNKNMDAQLCMKVINSIYDCDLTLLRINSFFVDYLSSPNKVFYAQEFDINLDKLRGVIDIMASSLSILGHIIPKNEYNQKILPNLEKVIDDLEEYYGVVDNTFRDLHAPMPDDFIKKYNEVCENSRMKYRSVIEELRQYYRA
ncbi:hypothetical protein [Acinetobacter lwoffii]|uniref:hypothetical protein n=1 Tax=Acinetobacter lwoffii TaxID=28090 RepID=UPI001FF33EA1|nr:hypothetical protein [Acinetobacter lwoffii]MCJ8512744.1 hypothetical protein [Acinetobacter lwoffii]